MARLLVLVHGMGVGKPGWAAPVVAKLNSVAKRYEPFQGGPEVFLLAKDADDTTIQPRPDQVLVVPAGYDAELRGHVSSFQRDTQAIITAADAAGIQLPGAVINVLQWFRTAGETEKNFFWTHIVDVLLYRFFPLVGKQLRVVVMEAIAKSLARVDADVSVMAHSLGTAVTHEALSTLGRGVVPELSTLMPPGVRLRHVFMIANVSRILEEALTGDVDVYLSPVCPISVRGENAYCDEFYNFRHILDPFVVPRRFDPEWDSSDFIPIDHLRHVADFDVHGWEHYLDNPEAHIPILNAFAGFEVVDDGMAHAAIRDYKVAPVPLCKTGMDFWVAGTHRIEKQLEETPTVAELLRKGAEYYATVQAARVLCGMPAPQPLGADEPQADAEGGL